MDRRTSLKIISTGTVALSIPACMTSKKLGVAIAPGMPDPVMLESNNISMGVYEKGQGVPVIFCHGFPELAFSWRHQFNAVADAGFHAIAPDLRGYGLTDSPENIDGYATANICDDLIGMMDKLAIEKAVFCGHDWGGYLVDTMPLLYPQRCLGVIGIGSSNNQRPRNIPSDGINYNDILDKLAFNQYVQQAETIEFLDNNVREIFSIFFKKDYFKADKVAGLPLDAPERRIYLQGMVEKINENDEMFVDDKAFNYYVDTFKRTGFNGGVNWYKAIPSTIEGFNDRELHWGVDVPYLFVWPEQDPINRIGLNNRMEDYIPDLEKVELTGSGHFAMEEKPEELSFYIVEWLQRKFMADA